MLVLVGRHCVARPPLRLPGPGRVKAAAALPHPQRRLVQLRRLIHWRNNSTCCATHPRQDMALQARQLRATAFSGRTALLQVMMHATRIAAVSRAAAAARACSRLAGTRTPRSLAQLAGNLVSHDMQLDLMAAAHAGAPSPALQPGAPTNTGDQICGALPVVLAGQPAGGASGTQARAGSGAARRPVWRWQEGGGGRGRGWQLLRLR